jgi:hypothetical protein
MEFHRTRNFGRTFVSKQAALVRVHRVSGRSRSIIGPSGVRNKS